MAALTKDTLYFRADHRDGFVFEAGHPAPSKAEGWVLSPDKIVEQAVTYEHTSLASFDEALRSERAAALTLRGERDAAMQAVAQLLGNVATLKAANETLMTANATLAARISELRAPQPPSEDA